MELRKKNLHQEREYIMYLRHYVFRLQEYYDRSREEFFHEKMNHVQSLPMDIESKLKLEEEIRRVNNIIDSYNKFHANK